MIGRMMQALRGSVFFSVAAVMVAALIVTPVMVPVSAQGKDEPRHPVAKAATKPPRTEQPPYLAVPFDPDAAQLAPGFRGHDLKRVYAALQGINADKSKTEYETTAEYEQRMSGIRSKVLFGSVTAASQLAFVAREPESGEEELKGVWQTTFPMGFSSHYEADAQRLTITLPFARTTFYGQHPSSKWYTVTLTGRLLGRDKYIGTNAFGVKAEVSRSYYEEFGLALEPHGWPFDENDYMREPTFTLDVLPETAIALKSNLCLVFIGILQEPWIDHTSSGYEPTLDAPYEAVRGQRFVHFVPQQIWAVNASSGSVLQKFVSSGGPRLLVEIAGEGIVFVSSDEHARERVYLFKGQTRQFKARNRISVRVEMESWMRSISFKLNGNPITPQWNVEREFGYSGRFQGATATFEPP